MSKKAKEDNQKEQIAKRGRCYFCATGSEPDYKNLEILGDFLSHKNRIRAAEYTGSCRKHQGRVGRQIKRARYLALMPYV